MSETDGRSYRRVRCSDLQQSIFSESLPCFLLPSSKSPPNLFHMSSDLTRHNGDAIRALRIKSGLKPGAFATKAQVSYAHLDNLENERKEASVEVVYRIAAALDVSPRAIVRDPSYLVGAEGATA